MMFRVRLLRTLLLFALVCSSPFSRAHPPADCSNTHCEQHQSADPPVCRDAVQCEMERERQQSVRNVLQREVQRAEAARRLMQPAAGNVSTTTPPLCPLLHYTPQLWREPHTADPYQRYTLRLAHITPAYSTLTHITSMDVHYTVVDSRLLSVTGPVHTARVATDVLVGSIVWVELSGLELRAGEALRLFVVYRLNDRECNDAPTVLFVD